MGIMDELTRFSLIGNPFGKPNDPSKKAMGYLDQIPGAVKPYYEPYFEAGKAQLPGLAQSYGSLVNDPGGMLNKIGGSYQESPGLQFAIQRALQGAGNAAAAGGMAGSPQHQFQNMELATGLANQDYGNWMNRALGLYGTGLGGQGNLAGMGLQAGGSMADQIAQALAAKAQLKYAGGANQNTAQGAQFGNIMSGIGALAAFL